MAANQRSYGYHHGGDDRHDREKQSRSVFIGNIPFEATEHELREIFEQAGPIVNFRLVHDRESGKPKGYGFIEYQDQGTAASCCRNLNSVEYNGRPLRVGPASGDQNSDIKALQQALGGVVQESLYGDTYFQSPYGANVEPEEAPEAISKAVSSLPPEQMFALMKQMKICIQNNPNEARNMLLQNPQLAYALLQAQIVMKIVEPEVAMALLHRESNQVPPVRAEPEIPKPASGGLLSPPAGGGPRAGDNALLESPTGGMHDGNRSVDPRTGPLNMDNRGPDVGGPSQRDQWSGGRSNNMESRGSMDRRDNRNIDPRSGSQGIDFNRGGQLPRNSADRDFRGDRRGGNMMGDNRGNSMDMRGPPQGGLLGGPRGPMPGGQFRGPAGPMNRGGPPQGGPMGGGQMGGGPMGAQISGGATGGPSQQDQEKAQLIMQVLQLSDDQIAQLPAEQRQSIIMLKQQFSQNRS